MTIGTSADADLALLRARIVRAVQRVCPAWLAAEADDIVQTTMMKITGALDSSEGNSSLPASYIWKAAFSATVDEIRRRRRRREVSLEEAASEAARAPSSDPARLAEATRIARGVSECLGTLAESRRLSVTLFLQGHTVPEASRLLGWSVKKVENLVFRGLADLRACLAAKGFKP